MSGAGPYSLLVAGTGFASTFFLERYLALAPASARVLVVEKGPRRSHATELTPPAFYAADPKRHVVTQGDKPWHFTIAFGGSSACWWACVPRFLPADFAPKSRYGVGADWPLSYDDLEPYYCDAETRMAVSGDSVDSPFRRSRPYPQRPHAFGSLDRALKALHPTTHFMQPTARPSAPTDDGRPPCCGNMVCSTCPIDSKFTIRRAQASVYADPRVTLRLGASVSRVVTAGGRATGVVINGGGVEEEVEGAFVALGTNAAFNPHILAASGLAHPTLGQGLGEQRGAMVTVDFTDLDCYGGATSITGHNYAFYDGPHRREHAACLIEVHNRPQLRLEAGRWMKRAQLKFIFGDLRQPQNRVQPTPGRPLVPTLAFEGHSEYTKRGLARVPEMAEALLKGIAIDRIHPPRTMSTESHLLGTAPMGNDPATSVVDRHQIHHQIRNLAVLGGSSFVTLPPANPTLTIAALSLWSAQHIFGR